MSAKQTISINGRHYDAHTGLAVNSAEHTPVATSDHTPASHPVHKVAPRLREKTHATFSTNIHGVPQKSQTLNRRATKRPQMPEESLQSHPQTTIITPRRITTPRTTPLRQHPNISKFAKHPTAPASNTRKVMDIGPMTHPHVAKAHAISHAKANTPKQHAIHQPVTATTHSQPAHNHTPSHVIKTEAIQKAIENTRKQPTATKKRFLKRHPRAMSIVSATLALVMLGGYLTYLNMPALSVRVAAAQAGINAAYPNYRPDGYSLNGPVAYNQGQVTMKFAANGGPQSYTIKQTKSGWDSAAVLDNYVTPKAGSSYIPYTERGLTIYAYDGNAAWVNGGILYTVEGDAPLSSDQLRRIATSLI